MVISGWRRYYHHAIHALAFLTFSRQQVIWWQFPVPLAHAMSGAGDERAGKHSQKPFENERRHSCRPSSVRFAMRVGLMGQPLRAGKLFRFARSVTSKVNASPQYDETHLLTCFGECCDIGWLSFAWVWRFLLSALRPSCRGETKE